MLFPRKNRTLLSTLKCIQSENVIGNMNMLFMFKNNLCYLSIRREIFSAESKPYDALLGFLSISPPMYRQILI